MYWLGVTRRMKSHEKKAPAVTAGAFLSFKLTGQLTLGKRLCFLNIHAYAGTHCR